MTADARPNPTIRAVLWDFGGVFTESPFKAFVEFERRRGLPEGFVRRVNSVDPDHNAWARFERSEIGVDEFDVAFAAECTAMGHRLRGSEVIGLLHGAVRGEMVEALRRCKAHFLNACLTNNVRSASALGLPKPADDREEVKAIFDLFDLVIESSTVGVRKPEPRFYRLALEGLGIEPAQAVYLDDLGINLKPARAMGMTTIKVDSSQQALGELQAVLNIPLVVQ